VREGGDQIHLRVVLELIEDRPLSEGGHRNLGPIWAELWTPPAEALAVQRFSTAFAYVTPTGIRYERAGPVADFVGRDPRDLAEWWFQGRGRPVGGSRVAPRPAG
jgi:hypothetical protein